MSTPGEFRFWGSGAAVDGPNLCRIFNQAIAGQALPARLSFDHDRLFDFHRWQANLRILDIAPVRSVPRATRSHCYVERLIGTVRREYLDRLFFWNGTDLERKLRQFQAYYNGCRVHGSLEGFTPRGEERRSIQTTGQPGSLELIDEEALGAGEGNRTLARCSPSHFRKWLRLP
jgi:hypothetical protein